MNALSFQSANFVAKQVGFHMDEGWGQGDSTTNAYFHPADTFGDRFERLIEEVAALGFNAIDLWTAHLHYKWVTPEHVATAKAILAKHGFSAVSYAGYFGDTVDEFTKACELCAALNIPVLGGGTALLKPDRSAMVSCLREHKLVFGYENHPEKEPDDVFAKIGVTDKDVIGVTIDTGWFATQDYSAPNAIRELASRVKHIHLKDVKARRSEPSGFQIIDMGHETCALGDGIADIPGCVKAIVDIGYTGAISIEHEPENFDPSADVKTSKARVEKWLTGGQK